MKSFCILSKLLVFTAFLTIFTFAGININSYNSEIVIAAIQEPPPSPPIDPDPPPPPPDPFTLV